MRGARTRRARAMIRTIGCRYFRRAFGWCVPIGALGGLIGLGGGEFRLPVLMYGIGYDARTAVPLNLVTSFVTLAFSLAVRSGAISLDTVVPYVPAIIGLLAGGMLSAAYGTRLVRQLSDRRLVCLIAALLAGLGVLLLCEAFLSFGSGSLLPLNLGVNIVAGFGIGLSVGIVSSVLCVAG